METAPKNRPILAIFGPSHVEGIEWGVDDSGWNYASDGDRPQRMPKGWVEMPAHLPAPPKEAR